MEQKQYRLQTSAQENGYRHIGHRRRLMKKIHISLSLVCVVYCDIYSSDALAPCVQVLYLQQAEVTRERVYAMHPSSHQGVEDMSCLAELHEAAIMHNLHQRYKKDSIYVSVCGGGQDRSGSSGEVVHSRPKGVYIYVCVCVCVCEHMCILHLTAMER